MLPNLNREEFIKVLHTNLSPTSPIQSGEHLYGRQKQLQQVEQALCAAGRSIFVYGDRGVGKTSLAQTVAYSHNSARGNPVLVACTPHTTFSGLMSDVIVALQEPRQSGSSTVHTAEIGWKGMGLKLGRTRHENGHEAETALDLNGIVTALLRIGSTKPADRVVVVDEFDRIVSEVERTHFADFIKQSGDQRIPIRFVFCGVAEAFAASDVIAHLRGPVIC